MGRPTLLLGLALSIAGAAYAQSAAPGSAAERGRSLFQQSCAFCHGPDATGAEGPSLILSGLVRHDKDGDLISEVIRNGRPDRGMPAFPLTSEQMLDIARFLHARVQESDRRSAGEPGAGYSLSRLDTGNAEAGQRFFDSYCTSCHSTGGDLRGIASKYQPVILQTAFLYPRDIVKTATIKTAAGETFAGKLAYSDPFTIAIRDGAGWYRSWNRKDVIATITDPLAGHRALLGKYSQADMHNVFAYLETLK